MFIQDIPTFTAKGEQGIVGAFFQNPDREIIGARHATDYIAIPPFRGPSGIARFNNVLPGFAALGAFTISNRNRNLPETIRWVDFWFSEQGAEMKYLGLEGVTFTRFPDGSRRLTELITNNPNGLNQPQAIGQWAIAWAGGGTPIFATQEMVQARVALGAADFSQVVTPYLDLVAVPVLSFTPAEQQQLNPIISDMITYIDESKVQFVTGRRPLSQWDAYVRNIRNMGADRYVAAYQAAFDRFMGR
jgi:putative aldouronate transport system substrate-binding protein